MNDGSTSLHPAHARHRALRPSSRLHGLRHSVLGSASRFSASATDLVRAVGRKLPRSNEGQRIAKAPRDSVEVATPQQPSLSIAVVGQRGAGKSALVHRFTEKTFYQSQYKHTESAALCPCTRRIVLRSSLKSPASLPVSGASVEVLPISAHTE